VQQIQPPQHRSLRHPAGVGVELEGLTSGSSRSKTNGKRESTMNDHRWPLKTRQVTKARQSIPRSPSGRLGCLANSSSSRPPRSTAKMRHRHGHCHHRRHRYGRRCATRRHPLARASPAPWCSCTTPDVLPCSGRAVGIYSAACDTAGGCHGLIRPDASPHRHARNVYGCPPTAWWCGLLPLSVSSPVCLFFFLSGRCLARWGGCTLRT